MRATRNGFVTLLVVCVLAPVALAQTPPTKHDGGYFAQVGDAEPPLRNLIPAPLTPSADRIAPMQAAATWEMESNPTKTGIVPAPAAGFIKIPPTSDPFQSIPSPWNQTAPQPPSSLNEKLSPYWATRPDPLPREKMTSDGVTPPAVPPQPSTPITQHIRTTKDIARGKAKHTTQSVVKDTDQSTAKDPTQSTKKDGLRGSSNMSPSTHRVTGSHSTSASPYKADISALIHECPDCVAGSRCFNCGPQCGVAPWEHFTTFWLTGLYMRPRNADIAYAVPIDRLIGTILPIPIQVGQVDIVDPDYSLGYDLGFNLAINCLTSITFEYMSLQTSNTHHVEETFPNVLRSLVSHPSSSSAAADFLSATASLGIDMDVTDLSLRHLFVGGDVFAVNYFVGARYARLEQRFKSSFTANGTEDVVSDVDFDGAGIRLGIDMQRFACNHNVYFYSNAAASFMAGKFQTQYEQHQSFDPTIIETSWEAGRVVPILDLELGAGWSSQCGRFKVSLGYLYNAWFNTVKNDNFIQAVQQNDFNGLSNTITFDGLVGRAEFSF